MNKELSTMTESRIEKLTRIGQEMAAAVAEMRADAADVTSQNPETAALVEKLSVTCDRWSQWEEVAAVALTHLQSAGRLIPAGGMALTAEQVEDVRTAVWSEGDIADAAFNRLRALFPATEPVTVRDGSDLVVVQRSHTAKAVQSWMTLDLWTDLGKNDKDFDAEYERQGFGDLWATLLGEVRALVQATTPAPAEPAEEETKAEEKLVAHRDSKGDIYVGHALVAFKHRSYEQIRRWFNEAHPGGISERRYRAVLHLLNVEASSPVVPAPAETEWPTLDAVPADVRTVWDMSGDEYRRRKNGGWKFRYRGGKWKKITLPLADFDNYAPFVAAEEG